MQLRTRLVPLGSRMSIDGEAADAWHDAMAAQALLQAMDEVKAEVPYSTFRTGIEYMLDRAAEILAGWMGEE